MMRRFALTSVLVVAASGCARQAADGEFTVAAAASLTGVVEEALERWNADPAHAPGRATFAASSTLARQVQAGAPFDLLLSADQAWAEHALAAPGAAQEAPVRLASNGLALVVPSWSRDEIQDPAAWAEWSASLWPLSVSSTLQRDYGHLVGRRWTTADPAHVPLGRAARAHLESNGWWDRLAPGLVAVKDARAALRLVERREVEWGIVYRTDAAASERVVTRDVVFDGYERPQVSGALIDGGSSGAAAFLEWLAGPGGMALFEAHGFLPPAER